MSLKSSVNWVGHSLGYLHRRDERKGKEDVEGEGQRERDLNLSGSTWGHKTAGELPFLFLKEKTVVSCSEKTSQLHHLPHYVTLLSRTTVTSNTSPNLRFNLSPTSSSPAAATTTLTPNFVTAFIHHSDRPDRTKDEGTLRSVSTHEGPSLWLAGGRAAWESYLIASGADLILEHQIWAEFQSGRRNFGSSQSFDPEKFDPANLLSG